MDIKLAGCVILYNPDDKVTENISSYINYLDTLYVVDNGNGKAVINELQSKYSNVKVISHTENMGIAYSLNEVLGLCQNKYTHLLTMDQDSYFENNSAANYANVLTKYDWNKTLGISPVILDKNNRRLADNNPYAVITSGNFVNVKNALKIGGYDEKLFIDEVDNEFCYRGYLNGYFTVKLNRDIFMKHCIGDPISVKILGTIFHPMNHNYIRTYYIIRNRLYVYFKYHKINEKVFYYNYLRSSFRLIVGKIFFEKDKYRKIKSICVGFKDFCLGKMGKKNFE